MITKRKFGSGRRGTSGARCISGNGGKKGKTGSGRNGMSGVRCISGKRGRKGKIGTIMIISGNRGRKGKTGGRGSPWGRGFPLIRRRIDICATVSGIVKRVMFSTRPGQGPGIPDIRQDTRRIPSPPPNPRDTRNSNYHKGPLNSTSRFPYRIGTDRTDAASARTVRVV
jgi:hypothetical protein